MKRTRSATEFNSGYRGNRLLLMLVALILCFMGTNRVMANTDVQQKRISGVVTDTKGLPLPGVNVVVRGTTQGTITDPNGEYVIEVAQDAKSLVFTFIGMVTQEVPVGSQNQINVTMIESAVGLDEVVVVGYGTQKKVSLVNAVSNISSKELTQRISTNVNQALQGKLPGLTVIDYGGAPGRESLTLRIRGNTSLNSNTPLVLVDGIDGNLSSVNPQDIESVSILKDAAATAIYGSRGAAGVILVTTKAAKQGKMSVSYNGYFGIARSNNTPVHMEAVEYMKMQNAAFLNSYGTTIYADTTIQNWPANHARDPERYPKPHTWFQEMLLNAPQQSHTLTLSGGSDAVNTRVSVRYLDQDGVYENYNFKVYELRANTNFKASEKLLFKTNLNLKNAIQQQPYSSPISNMLQGSQWGVPIYKDGSYGLTTNGYSPLINVRETGLSRNESAELIAILRGEYEVIKGLRLIGQFSTTYSPYYSSSFYNNFRFVDKLWPSRIYQNVRNRMTDYRSLSNQNQSDLQVTYNNKIGKHTIGGIAGYSQIHYYDSNVQGYRQYYYNNDLQSLSQGTDDATQKATGGNSEWALRSYFARINYDYEGKYYLEFNARYDGSSRFADGNRYGFFPSVSAGWRVSEESFWQPLESVVNELKIRGSWGDVGSQAVGLYTYMPTFGLSNYIFNEAQATGYRQSSLTSTNLSWETTSQINVGLDALLFNGAINFTADYYNKTTRDILLTVPIPTVIGLNPTNQNAGVVKNWGFEFLLGGQKTFSDFDVRMNFMANYNKNTVIDLAGAGPFISAYGNSDWRTITTEGKPMNSIYGFETDGLFQTQSEVNGYAKWDASVGPGDVKYVDQNGDGQLTPDDFVILGKEMPDWTFSSNMGLGWKGLRLDLFWQAVTGSDKPITGAILEMGIWDGFCHEVFADYWTSENTDAKFPRPTKYTMKNVQISDRTMLNGAYLRLKNIVLSYDIPTKICDRMKIAGINVYISATNLLTFSELNMYNIDPEAIQRGIEATFPPTSVSTIGVNINF